MTARKKFPDTAYWNPALRTDSSGRATVTVTLPDTLTTWRATAIAQTTGSAFGRETSKVLSAKDFFVRVETPRFLTGRDRSRIEAIVHNDTDVPQTALLRLRSEGIVVSGNVEQSVQVPARGTGKAGWDITAGEAERARVDVAAWTPKDAAGNQLGDRVELIVPIRPHGREELSRFAGELRGEGAGEQTEVFRLDPAAAPHATRLTVRVTPSVASAVAPALEYLIGYPYGCTEQTMSRFLPDLHVKRLGGLGSTVFKNVPRSGELDAMVRDGLARLSRLQHESGGWGWWETDPDDPWMTAYVLTGLAEAKAQGYRVSDGMLTNGVDGAVKLLASADLEHKPFLLYALALTRVPAATAAAEPELGKLELGRLSPEGLAYVVLTEKALGRRASRALPLLLRKATREGGAAYWPDTKGDQYYRDNVYGTSVALRAVMAHEPDNLIVHEGLRWLMARRTGHYWEDTRATSAVLSALTDYLALHPQERGGGEVAVRVNGRQVSTVALTGGNLEEKEIVVRVPASALVQGKNDVSLARTGGSGTVFYSMELRQTVGREDMAAAPAGQVTVEREFRRILPKKAGSGYWTLQTEATGNQLRQGERIRVRLTVTVPRDLDYVLIEDPFPAGCEVTERGRADDDTTWNYWWSSIDVRDDRIAFFARRIPKGTHVIEYNLRAQTRGEYHTLPTLLQPMYASELRAWSAETRVVVK
jgi:hypothetical protein